jgi:hypothetical protein
VCSASQCAQPRRFIKQRNISKYFSFLSAHLNFGAGQKNGPGLTEFVRRNEMSDNFHPNSLVPKWSTVELPAIDDAPLAPAENNGSTNIRQAPPAAPAADKNGSGPTLNPVGSISGSRDRVDSSKSKNERRLDLGNPCKRVDLQKSIDAIEAWPSIHNGW